MAENAGKLEAQSDANGGKAQFDCPCDPDSACDECAEYWERMT